MSNDERARPLRDHASLTHLLRQEKADEAPCWCGARVGIDETTETVARVTCWPCWRAYSEHLATIPYARSGS